MQSEFDMKMRVNWIDRVKSSAELPARCACFRSDVDLGVTLSPALSLKSKKPVGTRSDLATSTLWTLSLPFPRPTPPATPTSQVRKRREHSHGVLGEPLNGPIGQAARPIRRWNETVRVGGDSELGRVLWR